MDNYDIYMENFDAVAARDSVVNWIRRKMNGFGPHSQCVIGISGGKDSSVVAALCVRALGSDRVVGVMMPNGGQKDIEDARQLVEFLGIKSYHINIENICKQMSSDVGKALCDKPSRQAMINMPARIRMTTLYMVAQTLENAFVVNTGNLSERFVGYFTWHGDSAGDFSPLAKFTTDEVVAIGDACGLLSNLTHKTPSDGLCGKTDEDRLGFTYHTLNKYIIFNEIDDEQIKTKIDWLHQKNMFKLEPLDYFPVEIHQFHKTR